MNIFIMTPNVVTKPMSVDTFYKHVYVDVPPIYMKGIVGKKGKHLKQCCVDFGVNSIWFNMKRNIIEIWGPRTKLQSVADHFKSKMDFVRNKIPDDELNKFSSSLIREEDLFVSGSVDGVITKEQMKLFIGKNGRHLKRITKDTGVSFIWYNDAMNSIDVWGPKDNLGTCVQELATWMNSFHKNRNENVDNMDMEMND
jgi:hypothetical protein